MRIYEVGQADKTKIVARHDAGIHCCHEALLVMAAMDPA